MTHKIVPSVEKKAGAAALWALVASVMIWSTPTLFQAWLLRDWDVSTQNFYRYLTGFLSVLPFAFTRARANKVRIDCRDFLICSIPAFPLVLHQIAQTTALHYIEPGIYTVIGRVSVIFTLAISFILLSEERDLIKRPIFVVGSITGMATAAGLLFCGTGGVGGGAIAAPGIWLAILGAVGWALYCVLIKVFITHLGSTVGFAITSAWTCVFLFPIMLVWGDVLAPLKVGWLSNLVMVVSGILCIGLGHCFFYTAIRHLGPSTCQNAILLSPVGAMLLSGFIFNEKPTIIQMILAVMLLLSVVITLNEQRKGPFSAKDL